MINWCMFFFAFISCPSLLPSQLCDSCPDDYDELMMLIGESLGCPRLFGAHEQTRKASLSWTRQCRKDYFASHAQG